MYLSRRLGGSFQCNFQRETETFQCSVSSKTLYLLNCLARSLLYVCYTILPLILIRLIDCLHIVSTYRYLQGGMYPVYTSPPAYRSTQS